MKIKIRKAIKKDFNEYLKLKKEEKELYNKLFNRKWRLTVKEYKKEFLKALSLKNEILLVAKEKEKIIGFLYGRFIKSKYSKRGIIEVLFVSKKHRRKNIGTFLINKFIDLSKERKLEELQLKIDLRNKEAINFYKKRGFKVFSYDMRKEIK